MWHAMAQRCCCNCNCSSTGYSQWHGRGRRHVSPAPVCRPPPARPPRRRSHDFFVCVQTYDVRRPRAHVCVCGSDIALSVPDVTCIYECRSVMSNATCQHTDYNGDVLLSNITFLTFAVSHVVFTDTVVLTRNAVV